jgi:hypothetical protein
MHWLKTSLAGSALHLTGTGARQWFEAQRSGNSFYFGGYTGRTPVPGIENPGKRRRLRNELREAEQAAIQVAGTDAERFFSRVDGA